MNFSELLVRGFAEALINFLTSIFASFVGFVFEVFLLPTPSLPFPFGRLL
jgi:hypothetical protein